MKYDGLSWKIVGSAGFTPKYVGEVSLAINDSGVPYVAFKDSSQYYS